MVSACSGVRAEVRRVVAEERSAVVGAGSMSVMGVSWEGVKRWRRAYMGGSRGVRA